ncbi:hypothetical protein HK105_203691 [Polyrhizophydium stewartii]|uniref:SAM-dependent MTase RsmB/NOP-type domain-containing protein n=1 Tax=Polyrhizophydium stewartii TaxID=2732419 RepID=A0ABR4NBK9_9FUNG
MDPADLPPWFGRFLADSGIDTAEYSAHCPEAAARHKALAESIGAELGAELVPVPWLAPDFWSLPRGVRIATAPSFRRGLFQGMDAASGLAVRALDLGPDDQVLEICCAPGTKLSCMLDQIGSSGVGTATGVDSSEERLAVARSLVRKHGHDRVRLFLGDGTDFDIGPPSRLGPRLIGPARGEPQSALGKRTHDQIQDSGDGQHDAPQAPAARPRIRLFHSTKLLRFDPRLRDSSRKYDKVLVDAECTTDASIAHVRNSAEWKGWDGLRSGWMASSDKLDELERLQRRLIANGLRMVRPGGILVFSTCSFAARQNEDVVAWLLRQPEASGARLVSVPGIAAVPCAPPLAGRHADVAGMQHVVRLSPAASGTSGLIRSAVAAFPRLSVEGILVPRATADTRLFGWRPTSAVKAYEAEHALLSQTLNVRQVSGAVISGSHRPTPAPAAAAAQAADPAKPSADLGHVEVGKGQFINTLVLEQVWRRPQPAGTGLAAAVRGIGETTLRFLARMAEAAGWHHGRADEPVHNLVVAHGYGAGLGFFYRNFPALASVPGYRVFAIDWLGMGASSRPEFPSVRRGQSKEDAVRQTEDFFVDSLEAWRQRMGLESMVLVGHSMGGYLSTAYALKHPDRVEKLLLVSPVGVPKAPSKEVLARRYRSFGYRLAGSVWEMNITPMSIVRSMGPWGPNMVKLYTSRRFAHMDQSEVASIDNYIYHISAQRGSGEFALAHLLAPGAWAYSPLHDRLKQLRMPVTFIYGDHDWMDYTHAMRAVHEMNNQRRVSLLLGAGHHLYFDNPTGFDNALIAEMLPAKIGPFSVPDVEYRYLID